MRGTDVRASVAATIGEEVRALTPVAGGDVNDAWRAELADGRAVFVKSRSDAEAADFAAEAAGLEWLAQADGARLPRVLAHGDGPAWIALEWIERGRLSAAGAEELGRGLAAIHSRGAARFGELPPDTPDRMLRIGPLRLAVEPAADWPAVYGEQLLAALARMAVDGGALAAADAAAVERVAARLGSLAGPAEAPARLHGDLWGGNVMADSSGSGWLIDPAAYGGHREIDLAMLRLFGSPQPRILEAYAEALPLASGHEERVALWQLLPLLVHAILFGGGYGASAGAAARRYL